MSDAFAQVEFLGFDVFGTVVDWRSGVARAAQPFLARHGIGADPFGFADDWRALYQPAMEAVRSGNRPWVRLEVLHRENLDAVLSRHGVAPGTLPEAELAELNRAWERLDPWPDAAAGRRDWPRPGDTARRRSEGADGRRPGAHESLHRTRRRAGQDEGRRRPRALVEPLPTLITLL